MENHAVKICRHGITIALGEYQTDQGNLIAGWFQTIKPTFMNPEERILMSSSKNVCTDYAFDADHPPSLAVRMHAQLMIANAGRYDAWENKGELVEKWMMTNPGEFDPIPLSFGAPNILG